MLSTASSSPNGSVYSGHSPQNAPQPPLAALGCFSAGPFMMVTPRAPADSVHAVELHAAEYDVDDDLFLATEEYRNEGVLALTRHSHNSGDGESCAGLDRTCELTATRCSDSSRRPPSRNSTSCGSTLRHSAAHGACAVSGDYLQAAVSAAVGVAPTASSGDNVVTADAWDKLRSGSRSPAAPLIPQLSLPLNPPVSAALTRQAVAGVADGRVAIGGDASRNHSPRTNASSSGTSLSRCHLSRKEEAMHSFTRALGTMPGSTRYTPRAQGNPYGYGSGARSTESSPRGLYPSHSRSMSAVTVENSFYQEAGYGAPSRSTVTAAEGMERVPSEYFGAGRGAGGCDSCPSCFLDVSDSQGGSPRPYGDSVGVTPRTCGAVHTPATEHGDDDDDTDDVNDEETWGHDGTPASRSPLTGVVSARGVYASSSSHSLTGESEGRLSRPHSSFSPPSGAPSAAQIFVRRRYLRAQAAAHDDALLRGAIPSDAPAPPRAVHVDPFVPMPCRYVVDDSEDDEEEEGAAQPTVELRSAASAQAQWTAALRAAAESAQSLEQRSSAATTPRDAAADTDNPFGHFQTSPRVPEDAPARTPAGGAENERSATSGELPSAGLNGTDSAPSSMASTVAAVADGSDSHPSSGDREGSGCTDGVISPTASGPHVVSPTEAVAVRATAEDNSSEVPALTATRPSAFVVGALARPAWGVPADVEPSGSDCAGVSCRPACEQQAKRPKEV